VITVEENEYYTQVAAGTPAGEMHRRYWYPIGSSVDVTPERVVPIRLLGEDLVLYKTTKGQFGLVQRRCPHRSLSLQYGWADDDGIRCAYHGWGFDQTGQCFVQPYEDTVGEGTFKNRVKITAYPVQELGGLLWTYLGPLPAPELPRWDILERENVDRQIQWTLLPCNWLQIAENSLDPVHVEWLHVNQANVIAERAGLDPVMPTFKHLKVDFDLFEYGIYKRRLVEGDPEDSTDWTVGHPLLFPGTLAQENMFQWRVPVDDTHTLHIIYSVTVGSGATTYKELPYADDDGSLLNQFIVQQDFIAWIGQGEIAPRDLELAGRSDRGILMFRQMLREAIEAVAENEDPIGVIRDPSVNPIYLVHEGPSPHTTRLLGGGVSLSGLPA